MARTPCRREEYLHRLPEVKHVGWYLVREAQTPGLAEHHHAGAFEICWIRRGCLDWWAGDQSYDVPQAHVYITHPDEPHGATHAVQEPCELFWAIVLPTPRLPGVAEALASLPRVFPGDERMTTAFRTLLDEHRDEQPLSDLGRLAAVQHLLALTVRLGQAVQAPPPLSDGIRHAIAWGHAHLAEDLPIADLARSAGLRPSRFHERFLAELGMTPADWLRRARLRRAKRLLADPARTITDIAFTLGFPSSQYFATVFKRYTGLRPLDWRRLTAAGPT